MVMKSLQSQFSHPHSWEHVPGTTLKEADLWSSPYRRMLWAVIPQAYDISLKWDGIHTVGWSENISAESGGIFPRIRWRGSRVSEADTGAVPASSAKPFRPKSLHV
jgi:hypothetical protein